MRSLDVFLGRYGMMQTDAQLTSSPKDTDTQAPVQRLTATSKHTKFACMHIRKPAHISSDARNSEACVLKCSPDFIKNK